MSELEKKRKEHREIENRIRELEENASYLTSDELEEFKTLSAEADKLDGEINILEKQEKMRGRIIDRLAELEGKTDLNIQEMKDLSTLRWLMKEQRPFEKKGEK